jgi:hypothetical protein
MIGDWASGRSDGSDSPSFAGPSYLIFQILKAGFAGPSNEICSLLGDVAKLHETQEIA